MQLAIRVDSLSVLGPTPELMLWSCSGFVCMCVCVSFIWNACIAPETFPYIAILSIVRLYFNQKSQLGSMWMCCSVMTPKHMFVCRTCSVPLLHSLYCSPLEKRRRPNCRVALPATPDDVPVHPPQGPGHVHHRGQQCLASRRVSAFRKGLIDRNVQSEIRIAWGYILRSGRYLAASD